MIRAIETAYKGYRFRSRLEARWAVFFDVLGIDWEYELEGFDLGEAGRYLPDFWLPQVKMWAEVKPSTFTVQQRALCEALCIQSGSPVLMLDGVPNTRNYWGYEPSPALMQPRLAPWDPGHDEHDLISIPAGARLEDWIMQEGHRYWETEQRFYAGTGAKDGEIIGINGLCKPGCLCGGCDLCGAVKAARSARFERGGVHYQSLRGVSFDEPG